MLASLFENKLEFCPFGREAMVRQGAGELAAVHLAERDRRRGGGMGHVRVSCNNCHDQLRQTAFFEPPHHRGHQPLHRLGTARFLAQSASATTARTTATLTGWPGASTQNNADDLPGRLRADDARGCPVGCDRKQLPGQADGRSSLATQTVTSYRLDVSFMPGTVSEGK